MTTNQERGKQIMRGIQLLLSAFLLLGIQFVALGQDSLDYDDPFMNRIIRLFPDQVAKQAKKTQQSRKSYDTQEKENAAVYRVPLGSTGNTIELSLYNATNRDIDNLIMNITEVPDWLHVEEKNPEVSLPPEERVTVTVEFDLLQHAPVGKQETVIFYFSNQDGYNWNKSIDLKVIQPTTFKVDQNYPNPFNPTTTIRYHLPSQMKVSVSIFNILGQRVAVLVDGLQEAGMQNIRWDATRFASGLYFYRIIAEGEGSNRFVRNKAMMLIK